MVFGYFTFSLLGLEFSATARFSGHMDELTVMAALGHSFFFDHSVILYFSTFFTHFIATECHAFTCDGFGYCKRGDHGICPATWQGMGACRIDG
jgi:hypothetical protein